jgi:hypothetical protein
MSAYMSPIRYLFLVVYCPLLASFQIRLLISPCSTTEAGMERLGCLCSHFLILRKTSLKQKWNECKIYMNEAVEISAVCSVAGNPHLCTWQTEKLFRDFWMKLTLKDVCSLPEVWKKGQLIDLRRSSGEIAAICCRIHHKRMHFIHNDSHC